MGRPLISALSLAFLVGVALPPSPRAQFVQLMKTIPGPSRPVPASGGYAISAGGDFNYDTYPDFVIGAPDAFDGRGMVQVFYGGPSFDTIADWIAVGQSPGDHFGAAVNLEMDLDGHSGAELLVGAPNASYSGTNRGRVYVYRGGTSPVLTPFRVIDGIAPGSGAGGGQLGSQLCPIGIWRMDGIRYWAASAPYDDGNRGYVQLFNGADSTGSFFLLTRGVNAYDYYGYAISHGDFNGDGTQDVVVGVVGYTTGGLTNAGRVELTFGAPAATLSTPNISRNGTAA